VADVAPAANSMDDYTFPNMNFAEKRPAVGMAIQ
jgi:hypothetical protein